MAKPISSVEPLVTPQIVVMPSPSQTVIIKPLDTVIAHVLDIVIRAPGCQIQYVASLLPDLTLREVCYTLCYLRRKGRLNLSLDSRGGFTVSPTWRLFH